MGLSLFQWKGSLSYDQECVCVHADTHTHTHAQTRALALPTQSPHTQTCAVTFQAASANKYDYTHI